MAHKYGRQTALESSRCRGFEMACITTLGDIICVNNASCGGVNMVDVATLDVLLTYHRVDVTEDYMCVSLYRLTLLQCLWFRLRHLVGAYNMV